MVGLDVDGADMHGNAKAVSLDPGSWPLFPELEPQLMQRLRPFMRAQWHLRPHAIPGVEVARRGEPDLVVLPRFTVAADTTVEPVRGASGLALLAVCAFRTRLARERLLARLARLVATTPCFQLTYGTLEAGVDAVSRLAGALGGSRSGPEDGGVDGR